MVQLAPSYEVIFGLAFEMKNRAEIHNGQLTKILRFAKF
jgi:hypothetical protein